MTDVPNQRDWRKVFQNTASDLKVEAAIAAAAEIIVKQATAANLEALVTLKGLRGIIPNPITATRVNDSDTATGVATTIIYTVGANERLHIYAASLSTWLSADAVIKSNLFVRNDGDAFQYDILSHRLYKAGNLAHGLSFLLALEADAGWDVCVDSDHANVVADGVFFAWIESV